MYNKKQLKLSELWTMLSDNKMSFGKTCFQISVTNTWFITL